MTRYCSECVLPSTKPDLQLDERGVCSACHAYRRRIEIDWEAREADFLRLVDELTERKAGLWDCLVPVSGGKDSVAQTLKMVSLGLRVLCVSSRTCDLTEVGRRNLDNIRELGVDLIEVAPDAAVRRQLNRVGLELVGDISWPEHVAIFSMPVSMACRLDIPLIVWGENSQNEYGGPKAASDNPYLDRRWLEEFGGLLGLRLSDLPALAGIPEEKLSVYRYPSEEELSRARVTGIFLGHYFPWDGLANAVLASGHGFEASATVVEGSIANYENLDNFQTGIHDYFKYLKFGFGRATDIASLHVRRGRLTRADAVALIERNDGRYPHEYLGRDLETILSPLGLSRPEFDTICDRHTNTVLFAHDERGRLRRRDDGSPLLVDPPR